MQHLIFLFQGALTHGDRRAGELRDLSRYNIDNEYGRAALEAVFKAIMGYEAPVVKPPAEYKGDFFKGISFLLSRGIFVPIIISGTRIY